MKPAKSLVSDAAMTKAQPISLIAAERLTLPFVLSWAQKGGFAVLDQGLFAGTHFLVNILLARWLEPAEYGAFAVAYSLFLLLGAFHTGILTEPMLVFGSAKYSTNLRKYLGFLLYGHIALTGIISCVLLITALVFWRLGSIALGQTLLGLAIAAPFILLLWLLRRAFYVHFRPQWAATGGALYLILTLAGMYVLDGADHLSALSALSVMGGAGLLVGLWLAGMLRPQWASTETNPSLGTVVSDHWRYGRWATATSVLIWVPGNIYYAVSPAWIGLEGSAALRAVMNLVMPVLHANAAISVLLVPQFVRAFKTRGKVGLRRSVLHALVFFTVSSSMYWCFLALFGYDVTNWIYGGRYTEHSHLLSILGLLPLLAGVIAVLGGALRAMERPDQVFWCYVASTVVALTLGLWLLGTGGVTGAVWGLLASSLTTTVAMIWFYISSTREGSRH